MNENTSTLDTESVIPTLLTFVLSCTECILSWRVSNHTGEAEGYCGKCGKHLEQLRPRDDGRTTRSTV